MKNGTGADIMIMGWMDKCQKLGGLHTLLAFWWSPTRSRSIQVYSFFFVWCRVINDGPETWCDVRSLMKRRRRWEIDPREEGRKESGSSSRIERKFGQKQQQGCVFPLDDGLVFPRGLANRDWFGMKNPELFVARPSMRLTLFFVHLQIINIVIINFRHDIISPSMVSCSPPR